MKKVQFNKLENWQEPKILVPYMGYKFDLPFGYVGFVDFTGYYWECTESQTCLKIGSQELTRKKAIQSAIEQFNKVGIDTVNKYIEKNKLKDK